MGSLTALLVLATLTSVYTADLPKTSYFKVGFSEGGVAALRDLELLSGFRSCYYGFGVKYENLSDLLYKVLKKGTLKPKIEKNSSATTSIGRALKQKSSNY